MPNSYEHSYQHDLDNVIDASDAVLAIGTEKVDTTTLKDRALSNDATIHGAMRASGYFDGGRTFDGDNDFLDCGNDSSLNLRNKLVVDIVFIPLLSDAGIEQFLVSKTNWIYWKVTMRNRIFFTTTTNINTLDNGDTTVMVTNKTYVIRCVFDDSLGNEQNKVYYNGILNNAVDQLGTLVDNSAQPIWIGKDLTTLFATAKILYTSISDDEYISVDTFFNTLARLPLYSHNFERYPNSDTSLTSVFPYTSGIIISGSFNKTDGLKCTSAGQIIFSNSFEFDGSEYITLIINGVEYSGTTTVTQGTITATIAQDSNDITIDMGTNDVLEDVQIQFRSEV